MDVKLKGRWFQRMPGTEEGWKYMEVTQRIHDGADCYPWTKYWAILPRRGLTGSRIFWQWAYKRKVWVVWGTGFHMEPVVEYATILDIMCNPDL